LASPLLKGSDIMIDYSGIKELLHGPVQRVGSLCPKAVAICNSAAGSYDLPGESMRALVPISSSGVARPLLPAAYRGQAGLRHMPSFGTRAKWGLVQILMLLCVFASSAHAAGTIFSTILTGSGQDIALTVTSDAQGNVYVAGLTYSPDFPVTAGAFQATFGGTCDAFVAKLGPNGQVIWSTLLGGILDDWATGVAVDGAGNVWVTGYTRSANFPLVDPIQGVLDNGLSDDYDAFVAKIDSTGTKLLYSTFLGGASISDHHPASRQGAHGHACGTSVRRRRPTQSGVTLFLGAQ
jgi:Beta-propeller repeat